MVPVAPVVNVENVNGCVKGVENSPTGPSNDKLKPTVEVDDMSIGATGRMKQMRLREGNSGVSLGPVGAGGNSHAWFKSGK